MKLFNLFCAVGVPVLQEVHVRDLSLSSNKYRLRTGREFSEACETRRPVSRNVLVVAHPDLKTRLARSLAFGIAIRSRRQAAVQPKDSSQEF